MPHESSQEWLPEHQKPVSGIASFSGQYVLSVLADQPCSSWIQRLHQFSLSPWVQDLLTTINTRRFSSHIHIAGPVERHDILTAVKEYSTQFPEKQGADVPVDCFETFNPPDRPVYSNRVARKLACQAG